MSKASHPYRQAPDQAFWKRAVAELPIGEVDPVVDFPFRIGPADKIATAGSCFAQHIARYLRKSGYSYFVTEPGHPLLDDETRERFSYGLFSARFGNIYSSGQLLQLVQRAYGEFKPSERLWEEQGRFIDPYRPNIQPDGFATQEEFECDQVQHLAAVRNMFEGADVLVFTLGLTEVWKSKVDGAVFPLCPGVAGGQFDASLHEFQNERVSDVVANLTSVINKVRRRNPTLKLILTVSPVPLMATASVQHVLVATTYSKSVLRVAAQEVCAANHDVAYFPSYEIVTGSYARGRYFHDDLRQVLEPGIEHVMKLFLRHVAQEAAPAGASETTAFTSEVEQLVSAICDEELLDVQ
jgi:hypothetical protein